MKNFISKYLGVGILVGVSIYTIATVFHNHLVYEAPDVTTISLCHWQLESGFREALQKLIDEYEKIYLKKHGKKIRITQIPIGEKGYKQYVNTTIIGGTAPDIIEKANAKLADEPAYIARFFVPLSRYVAEPNPYNEGTEFEGVPWRETFFDGLMSCYNRTLLDYYKIPFSMFTIRIYYNKDLYKKIIGKEEPPKTYDELISAWAKIKEYAKKTGEPIVPIAGSKEQSEMFRWKFLPTFFYSLNRKCDYDFNGNGDRYETWRAFKEKKWDFQAPQLISAWQCMSEIAQNFQDGWVAAQRDDAAFMFVQERSVMIASGSWDASSLIKQVGDTFKIGIFDFLIPTDHPIYKKYVKGKVSEATIGGGIPWSITKQSRNKDICIDFLRFCTTKKNNEEFNKAITWLPIIKGCKLSNVLKPFKPEVRGFIGYFDFNISQEMRLRSQGDKWDLFSGRTSPEQYGKTLQEIFIRTGDEGYLDILDGDQRNQRNIDRVLASFIYKWGNDTNQEDEVATESKIIQLMSSTQGSEANNFERKKIFDKYKN